MPKVIITEGCLVNYGDDRGGVHQDQGDLCEPAKDVALALVRVNRALYVNRSDDPDKAGANTASTELVRAAQAASKAKAKEPAEG
jgi:hypothetical protein